MEKIFKLVLIFNCLSTLVIQKFTNSTPYKYFSKFLRTYFIKMRYKTKDGEDIGSKICNISQIEIKIGSHILTALQKSRRTFISDWTRKGPQHINSSDGKRVDMKYYP